VIRELNFTVVGVPQTKGSTRAFVPKGWTRPIITNDNPKAKGWQQTIANCAALELRRAEHAGLVFLAGVAIDVTFYLPRPKKFLVKKWAGIDVPHTTRPDADKMLRVVKDALSKVVWNDDAQVTDVVARKRYCAAGEFPRVVIRVRDSAEGEHAKKEQQRSVGAGASLF
jgi:Holliday junction resolvase RusA-like endonuclease